MSKSLFTLVASTWATSQELPSHDFKIADKFELVDNRMGGMNIEIQLIPPVGEEPLAQAMRLMETDISDHLSRRDLTALSLVNKDLRKEALTTKYRNKPFKLKTEYSVKYIEDPVFRARMDNHVK